MKRAIYDTLTRSWANPATFAFGSPEPVYFFVDGNTTAAFSPALRHGILSGTAIAFYEGLDVKAQVAEYQRDADLLERFGKSYGTVLHLARVYRENPTSKRFIAYRLALVGHEQHLSAYQQWSQRRQEEGFAYLDEEEYVSLKLAGVHVIDLKTAGDEFLDIWKEQR